MAFKVKNFLSNDDVETLQEGGQFRVIEYKRDLSVIPETSQKAYFSSKMNVRKRQLVCNLSKSNGLILQSGAMQWMLGDVEAKTGIKGAADLVGKMFKSSVTKESTVKPEYVGNGILVTEPTYRHLIILDLKNWNNSVVLDDGLFLACDSDIKQTIVARSNLSSAVAGGEGLFNLCLVGEGFAVIESFVPKEELIEIELNDDVCKIDGNFAIAWSSTLNFTVEKSSKSLLGSAVNGEGLVNVYRGTGKILMAPVN